MGWSHQAHSHLLDRSVTVGLCLEQCLYTDARHLMTVVGEDRTGIEKISVSLVVT